MGLWVGLHAQTQVEGKHTAREKLWCCYGKQQVPSLNEHQIDFFFTYTTAFHLNHAIYKDVCKDKLKTYWVLFLKRITRGS